MVVGNSSASELPPLSRSAAIPQPSPLSQVDGVKQPYAQSGCVMGRDFDEDSDNDSHIGSELLRLSKLFEDASTVLASPARTGVLLNYLFVQSRDLAPTLFYLTGRLFQHALRTSKELSKDQKRIGFEIYSTFLHEKSPLRLKLLTTVVLKTYEAILSAQGPGAFDNAMNCALEMIQAQVSKLAQDILHGMETWRPVEPVNLLMSRSVEEELLVFELCLTEHLQSLQQSPESIQCSASTREGISADQYAQALSVALVTAHHFYTVPGLAAQLRPAKSSSVSTTPTSQVSSTKRSLFTRSVENLAASSALAGGIAGSTGSIGGSLQAAGSTLWTKVPRFCMKIKHKSHTHLFGSRKNKMVQRNHSLHERVFEKISSCGVCGQLLWGLAPQGMTCSYCNLTLHSRCKLGIRELCPRDGRKSSLPNLTVTGEVVDGVAADSQTDANGVSTRQVEPSPAELSTEQTEESSVEVIEAELAYAEEDQISFDGETRYVQWMKQRYVNAEGSADSASLHQGSVGSGSAERFGESRLSLGPSSIEAVQELIPDHWSDDPEMRASECFEAPVELARQFPEYRIPAKGQKSQDHIRLLVLLEFHQKTEYMVRYLKQYDYFLIRRWPQEHDALARLLCLDRIPELIALFRSLVQCIDATKTPQGYGPFAEAVLAWLTGNQDANLKQWARHCQALSCSNMLDSVRTQLRNYVRRNPDIESLLQTRYNKFVLVDGLKQMRVLYFNLPLISNNIAKDLEKTKSYRGEAEIWRKIHKKLASLPQTIDDVCMPLVKRINAGQLTSNLDRKDPAILSSVTPFEHMIRTFPRTLFNHWVVAHAEVIVDKLRVSSASKVNHDYIREPTDMLAILLNDALMLLVKDSDRCYTLRAFKAAREHGSVSDRPVQVSVPGALNTMPPAAVAAATTGSQPTVSVGGSVSAGSSFSSADTVGSPRTMVGSANSMPPAPQMTPSGSKLAPVFPRQNTFASLGEKSGASHHLLNIVFMDPTVLIRVLFPTDAQRKHWFQLLRTTSSMTANKLTGLQIQQQQKRQQQQQQQQQQQEPESQPLEEAQPTQPLPGIAFEDEKPELLPEVHEASSSEESSTPIERVSASIAEFERLMDQMRRALCETYDVTEEEYGNLCRATSIDEARRVEDLVLLQFDLTREWLRNLTWTVSRTLQNSNKLLPTEGGQLLRVHDHRRSAQRVKRGLVQAAKSVEQTPGEDTLAEDMEQQLERMAQKFTAAVEQFTKLSRATRFMDRAKPEDPSAGDRSSEHSTNSTTDEPCDDESNLSATACELEKLASDLVSCVLDSINVDCTERAVRDSGCAPSTVGEDEEDCSAVHAAQVIPQDQETPTDSQLQLTPTVCTVNYEQIIQEHLQQSQSSSNNGSQPNPDGVSVGRTDSQKSTTSSGFLELTDDRV